MIEAPGRELPALTFEACRRRSPAAFRKRGACPVSFEKDKGATSPQPG
jgi:hypothetical protein